jgi:pyruvate kinase
MVQNPRPTRAEASDVANAIIDGSDAVMLSGETAVGRYPREAVGMMARLVVETEKHLASTPAFRIHQTHELGGCGLNGALLPYSPEAAPATAGPGSTSAVVALAGANAEHASLSISEAICEATAHIAEDLKLGAIAIYTETGITARLISKYRPRAEVYAFAHFPAVCNRLNLLWGVRPIPAQAFDSVEKMVKNAEEFLLATSLVNYGDVVGIIAGTQTGSGSTNFIRLHRVGSTAAGSAGNPVARS